MNEIARPVSWLSLIRLVAAVCAVDESNITFRIDLHVWDEVLDPFGWSMMRKPSGCHMA